LAKLILLLLVLLGASLYFPQTRPVVVETLAPVLNPIFRWQTRGEMDRIGRELDTIYRQGNDLPPPGASFRNWMSKNFFGGAKTDAWGTDYSLTVWRDSIGLVSNGPDLEIGTADDIILSVVALRPPARR